MVGSNAICICGVFEHSTMNHTQGGPQKLFSAVSCSNVALSILKLRREDFKQTGSSTFKIG